MESISSKTKDIPRKKKLTEDKFQQLWVPFSVLHWISIRLEKAQQLLNQLLEFQQKLTEKESEIRIIAPMSSIKLGNQTLDKNDQRA